MVLYHFNRYPVGLVLTYFCTYHRTEEFMIALANYVVSQGVRITYTDQIFSFSAGLLCVITFWRNVSHMITFFATDNHCIDSLTSKCKRF